MTIRLFLAVSCIAAFTPSAAASDCFVYVVDADADTLLLVDVVSGVAETIGPLGVNAIEVDLAVCQGVLYMLDDGFEDGSVNLFPLDPITGAVVADIPVSWPDGALGFAEGLACLDGVLNIGFSGTGPDPFSEHLGTLSETGVIDSWVDLTRFGADFDAMTADESGIIGADFILGDPLSSNVYRSSQVPPTYDLLSNVLADLNDIAWAGDVIFGIDEEGLLLHTLDAVTGALTGSIAVSGTTSLQGIEVDRVCPGDIDRSGAIDVSDLLALLAAWGACPDCCIEDLDGNHTIDVADLLALLGGWGDCPSWQGAS